MPEMPPRTTSATSKQLQDNSIPRKTAQREEETSLLARGIIPEDIGLFVSFFYKSTKNEVK